MLSRVVWVVNGFAAAVVPLITSGDNERLSPEKIRMVRGSRTPSSRRAA